jgi:D-alanyl-D-alanine carboxypeptidase/D-alanyl-D-alanine-endopeptidase (penicillin-binding protein 4)
VYANGKVGAVPQIEWFPFDTDYVNFINDQIITPPNAEYDEYYQRLLGTNTVILQSTLPQGYVEKEALSVMDPPRFFLDTFKKYLQNGGIAVEGSNLVDSQPHRWTAGRYQQFVVHESPPLRNLLKQLNKESDNFYAEMVLKTAAAERYNTQGTSQLGVALVKKFARSLQLDVSNISLSDGSGMSATTLITTRNLSKLLSAMQQHREFKSFKNSLAVSGRDGSLKNRFGGSSLIGRVQAKTGYVSGVRTLSGYLQTKSNETLIFSIATNHYTANTSYIDSLHERMLEELYAAY